MATDPNGLVHCSWNSAGQWTNPLNELVLRLRILPFDAVAGRNFAATCPSPTVNCSLLAISRISARADALTNKTATRTDNVQRLFMPGLLFFRTDGADYIFRSVRPSR